MSILRFLLPLVIVLATCWASDPIFESIEPKHFDSIPEGYRLPTEVIPVNYKIKLEPHLNVSNEKINFTFNGVSTISINVLKKTNSITFHAKELTFDWSSAKLEYIKTDDEKNVTVNVPIKNNEVTKDKDFVKLVLETDIDPGFKDCVLTLTYTGILNDQLRGFYRSSYLDENNNKIWLATTHFEPVGARQAFPCWDEPALKATFDITIRHDKNYNAISNMDVKEKKTSEKDVDETIFKTTPVMSTYLVAFVVSDYKKKSNKDETFNVRTKPHALESTQYAFDIGQLILTELEDFTGIKYYHKDGQGMPKMDQISIPDFPAGAMENWGLVTYRESSLLYTENVTTTQSKQGIASTISHELAHQWFGNLVSPRWWKYIWLNEGFANFFQYYTTEKVINSQESSWRLMDQFVIKNLQASAFVTDASAETRPMNQDAATPEQIWSLFDNIAYRKAGSVIRMMQHFLTEDVFKEGLKKYLLQNKFNVADPDGLFNAIYDVASPKKVIPKNLKTIMEEWVNKEGYPVVTVTRDYNKTGDITLEQERFLLVKKKQQDRTQWWIPINYVTEESPAINNTKASDWLKPNEKLKIGELNVTHWVLLNNNQTGYYRVNYDDKNWERLTDYLNSNKYENINPVSRAQLIDDALNLARAGRLSYKTALKTTLYLSKETDYVPLYAAIRGFDYLDRVLQGAKNYATFHKYVVQKLEGFVKAVKLTEEKRNDTHVMKLSLELALTASCKYGLDECKTFAEKKLEKWLKDTKNQLPTDLRSGILCAGLRNADEKTWNMTLERYSGSTDQDEKAAILNGLGCVTSANITKKFLTLTIEDNPVVSFFDALTSIYTGNDASFDILIEFIQKNMEKIRKNDKKNLLLPNALNQIAYRITNYEQYGKLAVLAERHDLLEDENFVGLTNARENMDWIESYRDDIVTWITENYKEPKPAGSNNSANSVTLMSLLVLLPVLLTWFY